MQPQIPSKLFCSPKHVFSHVAIYAIALSNLTSPVSCSINDRKYVFMHLRALNDHDAAFVA